MQFLFTPAAEEHLERLPQQIKKRIASKMRFYEGQPDRCRLLNRSPDHRATASALAIIE
jgi:hypothetical protein